MNKQENGVIGSPCRILQLMHDKETVRPAVWNGLGSIHGEGAPVKDDTLSHQGYRSFPAHLTSPSTSARSGQGAGFQAGLSLISHRSPLASSCKRLIINSSSVLTA